jgi:1-deoxy-D-xylulose-5-phosphate reductoisomerase
MSPRKLTVLGSTGSIGTNTLDVVRQSPDRFCIFALAAGRNIELLANQINEFHPEVVVIDDPASLSSLRSLVTESRKVEFLAGPEALIQIATANQVDALMSSIVGVAGLAATYEAIRLGKRVGLANKEVLVSAGKLVMDAVAIHKAELIPVDSEHNGAHQCLRAGLRGEATKLILTASGGPFRNTSREALEHMTPADALRHPTWKMGNRITIDSATLMNKGFEVIEAHWLFGFRPDEIEVVVHPQSTIHAMVEYNDGSVIAQVSATDMRMPIQYALTWPQRASAPVPKIDWAQARQWEFFPPDFAKFPCLGLAYQCLREGGASSCILNAADEVAVGAFLGGRIAFPAIAQVVEETLARIPKTEPSSISDVLHVDGEARRTAADILARNAVRFQASVPSAARA